MKRIGMLVFSYYPADPRVRREAEVLNRAGFSVDVFCLRHPNEPPQSSYDRIAVYRIMNGSDQKESIWKYFVLSFWFMIRAFFHVYRIAFRQPYDLLHIHNMPNFLVFAGLPHKLMGKPLILDLHDLSVELLQSKLKSRSHPLLDRLVRTEEKFSCALADQLITTSNGFKQKLEERAIPAEKITLILNSTDEHIFRKTMHRTWRTIDSNLKLIYHGTIAERFGLHIAIEAVACLLPEIPQTTFHIYGKGDPVYLDYLKIRIQQLHLKKNIFLEPYQSPERLSQLITEADIAVVPYLSDVFMELAVSTKTFEYVFLGIPVVASRLPASTELFDEQSIHYVEPADPEELAEKIILLCKSAERQQTYAENASKSYQQFSWPKMEKRYLNIIHQTTNHNGN